MSRSLPVLLLPAACRLPPAAAFCVRSALCRCIMLKPRPPFSPQALLAGGVDAAASLLLVEQSVALLGAGGLLGADDRQGSGPPELAPDSGWNSREGTPPPPLAEPMPPGSDAGWPSREGTPPPPLASPTPPGSERGDTPPPPLAEPTPPGSGPASPRTAAPLEKLLAARLGPALLPTELEPVLPPMEVLEAEMLLPAELLPMPAPTSATAALRASGMQRSAPGGVEEAVPAAGGAASPPPSAPPLPPRLGGFGSPLAPGLAPGAAGAAVGPPTGADIAGVLGAFGGGLGSPGALGSGSSGGGGSPTAAPGSKLQAPFALRGGGGGSGGNPFSPATPASPAPPPQAAATSPERAGVFGPRVLGLCVRVSACMPMHLYAQTGSGPDGAAHPRVLRLPPSLPRQAPPTAPTRSSPLSWRPRPRTSWRGAAPAAAAPPARCRRPAPSPAGRRARRAGAAAAPPAPPAPASSQWNEALKKAPS